MKNFLNNGFYREYSDKSGEDVYGLESFNHISQAVSDLMHARRPRGYRGKGDLSNLFLAGDVYRKCSQFLYDKRFISDTKDARLNGVVSVEDMNSDITEDSVDAGDVVELVEDTEVPEEEQEEAAAAMVALLSRFISSRRSSDTFKRLHFLTRDKELSAAAKENFNRYYASSLRSSLTPSSYMPGTEAFGANIDTVLPDLRDSMTVTLLQFHRGLLNRILHRRTTASPYVVYSLPYAEVYNMLLSNDEKSSVRNDGNHRIPFLNLYSDPGAVSNTLTPIIPLKSNDTDDSLHSDGFIVPNKKVNILDLSLQAGKLGFSHVNYTDLISENVAIDKVLIKLHDDTNPDETVIVDVRQLNDARLNMAPNTNDSGIRQGYLRYVFRLDKNTEIVGGGKSKILEKCTDTDFLRVNLRFFASVSIKTGDVESIATISADGYNINGTSVASDVTDILDSLELSVEAYKLDASYSEENLRKSNLAVRYHIRTFNFEISNGRNILVDYSMNEDMPEFLMSLVTEATSLGQDHRGLDVIVKELMHVYDVTNMENSDPNFRNRMDKIEFQYVAAQQVRPVVYLNTIDLKNVTNIRDGDYFGDVRSYVEKCLLNLTSLYFQNSFFKQQLAPNAKPVFKVVSSSVIIDNLFSVPHYHNHLNAPNEADGSEVEYRRVLPNGVILDCVSCTYEYMRDKIVIIPYVDDPNSILSWGHNWDFGAFVAHYNYQYENMTNKRIFANTRSQVIPTNPSGLFLDVRNISNIIDMFKITNPMVGDHVSSLPQPSENIDISTLPPKE